MRYKQVNLVIIVTTKGLFITFLTLDLTPGITLFMEANSELVEAARTLVNSIPKVAELVKGHKKDPLEAKNKLNQTAVKLAGEFSWNPAHRFKLKHLPIAPPNYKVNILYDNSIITS
jgi:hypothetical protein